jgi:hypothetical protein
MLGCKLGNCARADVVAAGDAAQCLALVTAQDRFALLVQGELGLAAETLPVRLGARSRQARILGSPATDSAETDAWAAEAETAPATVKGACHEKSPDARSRPIEKEPAP